MTLRDQIRQFIVVNFYVSRPELVADDDSLLDLGVIDSTGVLEIVDFVERELGVTVADNDIVPQNFGSIAAVASFVAARRGAQQQAAAG
jgi:acyl carrier protein